MPLKPPLISRLKTTLSGPRIVVSVVSETDEELLIDLLKHGDNVRGNLAENIGRNDSHVSERLANLRERSLVEDKGRGVWSLTRRGVRIAQGLDEG